MKNCYWRLLLLVLLCPLELDSAAFAQDYDSLIHQAITVRNQGNFEEAEQILRQAYPIPADKSEVASLLGMVLAFQERFIEGLAIIDKALIENPDSPDLLMARARILSFQGLYRESEDIVERLLVTDPQNPDLLNLAGRLALYQQQPTRAAEYYQQSLNLNPENFDALIGLYDSEIAQGDSDEAETALSRAELQDPMHIEVLTRRNPSTYSTIRHHEIGIGYAQSRVDRPGISDWHDRYLEYRYRRASGSQFYARFNHNHHFDRHDDLLETGVLIRQNTVMPMEISLGYTDNADFMPEHYIRLAGSRLVKEASDSFGTLLLNGQYQYSKYLNGNTQRVFIGLEYYLLSQNAWLTPGIGMVRDQDGIDTFSATLGAHWQISGFTRIGINLSDAPETENLITTGSKSWGAYVLQTLNDSVSLRLNFNRIRRENSYTRESVSLGLQYVF